MPFGSLFGGDQADAATQAADVQAQAAKYAADLQKQMFEETRSDYKPWLNTGTSAINFLSDLNGLSPNSPGTTSTTFLPNNAGSIGGIASALQNVGNGGGGIWSRIAQMVGGDTSNAIRVPGANGTYQTVTTPGMTSAQKQQAAASKFFTDPGYQFSVDQGTQAIDRSAAAKGRLFSGATGKALQDYGIGRAEQQYGDWYNRIANLAGVGQQAAGSVSQAGQNYATQAGNAEQNAAAARASGYVNAANARAQGAGNVLGLLGTAASFFL